MRKIPIWTGGLSILLLLSGCGQTTPSTQTTKVDIVVPEQPKEKAPEQKKSEVSNPQPLPPTQPAPNPSPTYSVDTKLQQANDIAQAIKNTTQSVHDSAHLRSGPNISSGKVTHVPKGAQLYVQTAQVDPTDYRIWCFVTYNSYQGWISYKTLNPSYYLQSNYKKD
ncbi:SH3 domain-containing protein [Thermoflavimicrobium daqui]|uniref:SH3b domain-containing protein n=1 Tax=Thermoflavimicrobium daqui TaxID=2137476 RepID=A0A364K3Q7_9BACL|nr:SH3 domain-containing protein [Thermoflavimicrobium daqui]RAL23356.1 hypothetical protein DL897_11740 [Thermoflavimicrobium daqui]